MLALPANMNMHRHRDRRLAWALLASVALHLLLAGGPLPQGWLPAMQAAARLPPLVLRLPALTDEQVVPRAREHLVAPAPPPMHAPARPGAPPRERGPELSAPAPTAQAPLSAAMSEAPPSAPAEAAPAQASEPQPAERLPQTGKLVYRFYWSKFRWLAGQAIQQWEIRNGYYTLSSRIVTTGVFGLLRPFELVETAKGTIVGDRLRPLQFTTQINDNMLLVAVFNWENGYFRWFERQSTTTQDLPANSYDKISFLLQAYLDRATERLSPLQLTMGRQLDPYTIENLGHDPVDIDGASHAATHLRTAASAADTGLLDIWLSDEDNLPLKMTYTTAAGEYYEQLIALDSLPERPAAIRRDRQP